MSAINQTLAGLRDRWGARWFVWYVPLALGGYIWCAKRHDGRGKVLNAYQPEHLEEYLADAEPPPS